MSSLIELKYGIFVAEVNDVVPRRVPSLPNLYVGITTMELSKRFEVLNQGKGSRWLKNNLMQLREDISITPENPDHDVDKKLKKI